jgi:hypothetical protein
MSIGLLAILFSFVMLAQSCTGHRQIADASAERMPVEALQLVRAFRDTDDKPIVDAAWDFDMWIDSLMPQQLDVAAQAIQHVVPAAQDFLANTEQQDGEVDRGLVESVERWTNLLHIARGDIKPAEFVIEAPSIEGTPVLLIDGDGDSLYLGEGENRRWIGRAPQHLALGPGLHEITVRSGAVSYHFRLDLRSTGIVVEDASFTLPGLCYRIEDHDLRRTEIRLHSLEQRHLEEIRTGVARLPIGDLPPAELTCDFHIGFGTSWYYRIVIASDPAGATININGDEFGLTPQELLIRSGQPNVRVLLSKPGYIEAALEVDLDKPVAMIRAMLAALPEGS